MLLDCWSGHFDEFIGVYKTLTIVCKLCWALVRLLVVEEHMEILEAVNDMDGRYDTST